MGYRSDVKLIITKQGWEEIDRAVKKAAGIKKGDEANEYWLTSPECCMDVCEGKYVIGEWESIKWYEGLDDEVDAIMRMLERTKEPYMFMRVGENYEDTQVIDNSSWEKQYDDMPALELVREINVEYK